MEARGVGSHGTVTATAAWAIQLAELLVVVKFQIRT